MFAPRNPNKARRGAAQCITCMRIPCAYSAPAVKNCGETPPPPSPRYFRTIAVRRPLNYHGAAGRFRRTGRHPCTCPAPPTLFRPTDGGCAAAPCGSGPPWDVARRGGGGSACAGGIEGGRGEWGRATGPQAQPRARGLGFPPPVPIPMRPEWDSLGGRRRGRRDGDMSAGTAFVQHRFLGLRPMQSWPCRRCWGGGRWWGGRGGGGVGLGWVKASSGPPGPRTSPFPARHNWSGGFTVVRSQGLPD